MFFYACIVLDLRDRSVVGWRVGTEENVEVSRQLIRELKAHHGLQGFYLTSDNGNPMKRGTIFALFYELRNTPPSSRPRVSDDHSYVESFTSTPNAGSADRSASATNRRSFSPRPTGTAQRTCQRT